MTVEELRDQVMANCGVGNPWYGDPIAGAVDLLINAARSEGAEQMKQRIRNTCDLIEQGDEVSCTDVTYAKCTDSNEDYAAAIVDLYVVPASALAPKEKP